RVSRRTAARLASGGILGVALGGLGSLQPRPAGAQKGPLLQTYRIGLVAPSAAGAAEVVGHGPDPQDSPNHRTLRARLDALRYVVGAGVRFEYRYAQSLARITAFAAELAALPVDVLIAQGPATRSAIAGAGMLPVVFVYQGDPVAQGVVPSLAHPGGNVTGVF